MRGPAPDQLVYLTWDQVGIFVQHDAHRLAGAHPTEPFHGMGSITAPAEIYNQDKVAYCTICFPIVIPDDAEVVVDVHTRLAHRNGDIDEQRHPLPAGHRLHGVPWLMVKGNVTPCEECWT